MITAITIIGCLTIGLIIGYRLGKRGPSREYLHGVDMGIILEQLRRDDEMSNLIKDLVDRERSKG